MATLGNLVDVAVEKLLTHAEQRYEDSYAYHALYWLVQDLAEVPRWAWGDLPWSDRWHEGWTRTFAHRATEARTIRDEMAQAGGRLVQVVADYTDTDVEIALDFQFQNQDVMSYLDVVTDELREVEVVPGGAWPLPEFPPRPSSRWGRSGWERPNVISPGDNERLQTLFGEQKPAGMQHSMGVDPRTGATVMRTAFHGPAENDELERFVQEYGERLIGIEQTVRSLDPGARLPWTELVEPAWLSCPSFVGNRAELLKSVANAYQTLGKGLRKETGPLANYWSGAAAASYTGYAEELEEYVTRIEEQARDLAEQGTQAGIVLENLRNHYADIGYQHIRQMIDRHEEYVAVVTSTLGRISECSTPGGAATALLASVNDFHGLLADKQRRSIDAAQGMLSVEQAALAGEPDFGATYDPVPFVPNALNPYSDWDRGEEWESRSAGGQGG